MPTRIRSRSSAGKLAVSGLAVAVAVSLVGATPRLVGMSWAAVGSVLSGVPIATLFALAALWILGLLVHTVVLTAALPGLTCRRALLLNLSGSAASNLLPFGGAAGMGWGYVMARSWRISPTSFASFTVISNAWNVVGKALVGVTLVGGALVLGAHVPASVHVVLMACAATVLLLLGASIALLRTPTTAARFGRALDIVVNTLLRLVRRQRHVGFEHWLVETRAETATTIGAGWARLTLGVTAYLLMQALLLAACLYAVGAHLPLIAVAAAFGTERLLTLIPLTPGGSGFAELGTVAILVALGGAPVGVAAGVLLYRFYSHLLEIPVGGASGLLWMRAHRRGIRKAALA